MSCSADTGARLRQAWELCFVDALAARAAALGALSSSGVDDDASNDAWARWHLALADARTGGPTSARARLAQARERFRAADDGRGLSLCDELDAILARDAGDLPRCAAIQDAIDAAEDAGYTELDRYFAHDSRATTARLQGEPEWALTHLYEALDAAEASGNAGARATALDNLGALLLELHDLEDARQCCEKALAVAQACGARALITRAAAHLILVHHRSGRPREALEMAQFLVDNPHAQLPGALSRVAVPLALAYYAQGDIERADVWLGGGSTPTGSDGDGTAFWAWLSARCLMHHGEHAWARDLLERSLLRPRPDEQPYHPMMLARAAADACEALGDLSAALVHLRHSQTLYEQLVDHGLRARNCALQAAHDTARVQRELATAQRCRVEADADRRRLAEINQTLQAKVAEVEQLHGRLREQALRDPLTGLHNRRYLFETAAPALEHARSRRRPLSVAVLDLDHFKALNDGHGHAVGDAMLERVAALMLRAARPGDTVCRLGGEEFVIVMPGLDGDEAAEAMQSLLDDIASQRLEVGTKRLPVSTFSAGVASFPAHGDNFEALLGRADKAMYRAKQAGRARVEPAFQTGFAELA